MGQLGESSHAVRSSMETQNLAERTGKSTAQVKLQNRVHQNRTTTTLFSLRRMFSTIPDQETGQNEVKGCSYSASFQPHRSGQALPCSLHADT